MLCTTICPDHEALVCNNFFERKNYCWHNLGSTSTNTARYEDARTATHGSRSCSRTPHGRIIVRTRSKTSQAICCDSPHLSPASPLSSLGTIVSSRSGPLPTVPAAAPPVAITVAVLAFPIAQLAATLGAAPVVVVVVIPRATALALAAPVSAPAPGTIPVPFTVPFSLAFTFTFTFPFPFPFAVPVALLLHHNLSLAVVRYPIRWNRREWRYRQWGRRRRRGNEWRLGAADGQLMQPEFCLDRGSVGLPGQGDAGARSHRGLGLGSGVDRVRAGAS